MGEGLADPPAFSATTDSRGRFQLTGEVAAGRWVLLLSRDGYAAVLRRLALEPGQGQAAFDGRLTPRAEPAGDLDPVAGATVASTQDQDLRLIADPHAVPGADDLTVYLTARTGQGLPDLLPLGWTPLATVELRLESAAGEPLPETTSFAAGGVRLELPLPDWVEPSDTLYAVRYSRGTGLWVALDAVELYTAEGQPMARVRLPGPGTVAIVLPDSAPGAVPPLPEGAGQPLLGVSLPETVPELHGDLTLTPPQVPPTGVASARVVARSDDGETPWPSGLAVVATLAERLLLSGGGQLLEAPYSSDLVLYHERLTTAELGSSLPAAAGAVEFSVSPSERAREVLLDVGYENVRLDLFPGQIERGLLLGPAGGSVASADGVELDLPEGALAERTAISARLLSGSELQELPPVLGFTTLAGVRLEWGGQSLQRDATLRLPLPDATPDELPGDAAWSWPRWSRARPTAGGATPASRRASPASPRRPATRSGSRPRRSRAAPSFRSSASATRGSTWSSPPTNRSATPPASSAPPPARA